MSTEPHGIYFPSSQATVLVVRPDDAEQYDFPKENYAAGNDFPGSHFSPENNSMNPSRMELARELTPNSSPPMMSQKLISTGPLKSRIDRVDRGMTATLPLAQGMGSKNSLVPH
jgi:hypothetical protein